MSKTVSSYQEIGHEIDSRKMVVFTSHPTARVTVQQRPWPDSSVKITINLSIGDTCVGIMENEYANMLAVLDAFRIDDLEEVWEMLE